MEQPLSVPKENRKSVLIICLVFHICPPRCHKKRNPNVVIQFPAQCFTTSIQLNSGVFFTPKMVHLQYSYCKNITNSTHENTSFSSSRGQSLQGRETTEVQ